MLYLLIFVSICYIQWHFNMIRREIFLDTEQIRELPQSRSMKDFIPLLSLTEACGIFLIILMIIWTGYYRNGFSWKSNPQLEFNWHPLLMTIGLVFLYANGITVYLKITSFTFYARVYAPFMNLFSAYRHTLL